MGDDLKLVLNFKVWQVKIDKKFKLRQNSDKCQVEIEGDYLLTYLDKKFISTCILNGFVFEIQGVYIKKAFRLNLKNYFADLKETWQA